MARAASWRNRLCVAALSRLMRIFARENNSPFSYLRLAAQLNRFTEKIEKMFQSWHGFVMVESHIH